MGKTMVFSHFKKLSFVTLIFYFAVFCHLFSTTEALVKLPPNQTVPAVIVFGDSIVDPGNNNNRKTISKANFPPYGKDFMGGIPSGRFSNGKVPSDIIAEELGIKDLIPAYLDPKLQPSDLITGVNFASGGVGFDPITPRIATAITFPQQLDYFKEYIGKLKAIVGEDRANFILTNSLYLLVAGSNDIANTYFRLPTRQLEYDVPAYADFMVNGASSFLKDLYNLGARRVAVFSAPPIGCVPSQRTIAGGISRDCVERYNEAAQLFNSKLSRELDSLNAKLPNSRMVYIDDYTPLLDLIQNYAKYDFVVANKGCCGTGLIEVTPICNPATPVTCPNTSSYVFWDSFHPTERAYKLLISNVLPKYITSFYF